jgi:hypothetical protein
MRSISGASRSLSLVAVFFAAANLSHLRAAPYASGIVDNAGTISFYLNESGGNVTIKYEDNSINPSYNGVTTGTNLASGQYTFSLGAHTSYTIAVSKTGTGSAGLVASHPSVTGNPRGVDVNKNVTSPYFGRVYNASAGSASATNLLLAMNGDLSGILTNTAGVQWAAASSSSPYRLSVSADDYLLVGDFSMANSGVWRIDPNLDPGNTNSTLVLGPIGYTAGSTAGVHGTEESRPLLIGNLSSAGGATLMIIDGDYPPSAYNSILVYSNLTLASLPWETAPATVGPEIGLNLSGTSLGNVYPGLTQGPNGYIYASTRRENFTVPDLDVYDAYLNPLWNSSYNSDTADYFVTTIPGHTTYGIADSAVSPDGKFVVGLAYDNHLVVCSLTNGIPDVSSLYLISPTSFTTAARGVCWDAADNVYVSSSGLEAIQEWTLGFTATAVTTGNASGPTGFALTLPSTVVGIYATNSIASTTVSQANSYGNPTNATFVIFRTGSVNAPLTVPLTLSGTAASGTYTITATTNVVIAAGQSSTNIAVTAITDGVPRPTSTIIATLGTSPTYGLAPGSATLDLINTAPDEVVATTNVPTMYNAFSNDYASFILTRWGDTNAGSFTVSSYTYGGTAVPGVDYTLPAAITFNPGDISYTNNIYPLQNGQPPVDSASNPYVGNKTAIIAAGAGTGFSGSGTNAAILTILDSANPPTTVLFADPLTSASDAANWGVTSANNNMQTNRIDDTVTFGYDLQNGDPSDYGAIPLPPNGAATALRVTVNKDATIGAAAGVNLYPTNVSFHGNYAMRFSMNLIQGYDFSTTTEGPLFGINHGAHATNWWSGSTVLSGWGTPPTNVWDADGIWYWIDADTGNGGGEYLEYTGLGGTNNNTGWAPLGAAYVTPFENAFKTNVFTGGIEFGPGLVSNGSVVNGATANNWADVEIKQLQNTVTLSIDKTPIFVYTNTTSFTNGTVMLGYDDPFSSVGTIDSAVYYSNLRVVAVGIPSISQIAINKLNSTAVINFTTQDGDATPATFTLLSSPVVTGPYAAAPGATVTALGAGAFQAVVPESGPTEFYRISQQ